MAAFSVYQNGPMFPAAFTRNIIGNWGDAGREWLAGLPALIDAVTHDWGLTAGDPYPLSFSWVAPVRRADGSPAVLKLGVPSTDDLVHQAAALSFFDGAGAVRLLRHDEARGAMLLEKVEPGHTLRRLVLEHDQEATDVLIAMMRRLHRPAPPDLAVAELTSYGNGFAEHLRRHPGEHPIPRQLVVRAAGLFIELCQSATERVVLHGDLHHENVLAGDREQWLAIDPHGLAGDPGYEVGPILYNPFDGDEPVLGLVPIRIEQFAEGLGMPIDRVVAWGFVQAVLSEVWDAESGESKPGQALDVALSLERRLS